MLAVSGDDLTTAEGWADYTAFVRERLVEATREKENTFVTLILFLKRDPLTGERLPKPLCLTIVTVFNDDDKSHDHLESIARAVSLAGDAFACMFTAETWVSTDPFDQTGRRVMPREARDRKEAVLLVAEHRDFGSSASIADITGSKGNRKCGPWRYIDGANIGGRFAGLVAKQTINNPEALLAIRFYIQTEINAGHMTQLDLQDPADALN